MSEEIIAYDTKYPGTPVTSHFLLSGISNL